MSSSSDSDSDDDSRFREACDSTLPYHERLPVPTQRNHVNGFDHNQIVDFSSISPETNETSVLCRKVQYMLSSTTGLAVHSSCNLPSKRRKLDSKCNNGLPSSISPYLGKELINLLDKKIEVEEPESSGAKESTEEISNKGEMLLLKNITIQSITNNKEVPLMDQRNGCDDYKAKMKEIRLRCKAVALSPKFILDKQDVYPWCHPKNLRYLESYRIVEKKSDGSLKLAPLCESSSINKSNDIKKEATLKKEKVKNFHKTEKLVLLSESSSINKNNEIKKEVKLGQEKETENTHNSECKLANSISQQTGETLVKGTFNGQKKFRKQSRKRGGKKLKKIKDKCESGDKSSINGD